MKALIAWLIIASACCSGCATPVSEYVWTFTVTTDPVDAEIFVVSDAVVIMKTKTEGRRATLSVKTKSPTRPKLLLIAEAKGYLSASRITDSAEPVALTLLPSLLKRP